jgi:hypothetical protein
MRRIFVNFEGWLKTEEPYATTLNVLEALDYGEDAAKAISFCATHMQLDCFVIVDERPTK